MNRGRPIYVRAVKIGDMLDPQEGRVIVLAVFDQFSRQWYELAFKEDTARVVADAIGERLAAAPQSNGETNTKP